MVASRTGRRRRRREVHRRGRGDRAAGPATGATFEANVPIVDRYGTLLAEADLLWRDLRVIVEIDSREFHYEAKDWEATMARHTFLTRRGFHVEHHSPSTIRADGPGWAAGVAAGLRARAVELGLPYEPGTDRSGSTRRPPAHRPTVINRRLRTP